MDAERYERERIVRIIKSWLGHYPKDIFIEPPPGKHGKTVDACSARAIRHALRGVLKDIRDGIGKD